MTIEEIREKKAAAEAVIVETLNKLAAETGMQPEDVQISSHSVMTIGMQRPTRAIAGVYIKLEDV